PRPPGAARLRRDAPGVSPQGRLSVSGVRPRRGQAATTQPGRACRRKQEAVRKRPPSEAASPSACDELVQRYVERATEAADKAVDRTADTAADTTDAPIGEEP